MYIVYYPSEDSFYLIGVGVAFKDLLVFQNAEAKVKGQ